MGKSSVTLKSGSWTETVRNPNVKVRDSPQLSPLTVVHIYYVHTLLHEWTVYINIIWSNRQRTTVENFPRKQLKELSSLAMALINIAFWHLDAQENDCNKQTIIAYLSEQISPSEVYFESRQPDLLSTALIILLISQTLHLSWDPLPRFITLALTFYHEFPDQ